MKGKKREKENKYMTGEPMTHPRNENEFIRAGVLPASANNYL